MNNFLMILFAAQVLVALIGFLCENGKDERFDGEKLDYRI
jgi:hypothetical protein